MKKKILVTATITIEGNNLSKLFIQAVLRKIKKFFLYRYRYQESDVELIRFELSDHFIELE